MKQTKKATGIKTESLARSNFETGSLADSRFFIVEISIFNRFRLRETNHSGYSWRRFLSSLSSETVRRVENLTSDKRETAFIIDDSMFERNRSKAVEMLARFKDHATGAFYKGYRMLTMGWSDGHSFIPVDFALLSSLKSGITGIADGIYTNEPPVTNVARKRFYPRHKSLQLC